MHTFLLPINGQLKKVLYTLCTWNHFTQTLWSPVDFLSYSTCAHPGISQLPLQLPSSSFKLPTVEVLDQGSIRWCTSIGHFPCPNLETNPKQGLVQSYLLKVSIPRKFQVKLLALERFCSESLKQLKLSEHFHYSIYVCLLLRSSFPLVFCWPASKQSCFCKTSASASSWRFGFFLGPENAQIWPSKVGFKRNSCSNISSLRSGIELLLTVWGTPVFHFLTHHLQSNQHHI